MKRLVITINNLGANNTYVEYVDINVWQGKRLLISDQIGGKCPGDFAKAYDINYDQEHPELLHLESNAPLGVSVLLSIEFDNDNNDNKTKPESEPTVASLAKEIELLKSTVALQKVQVLGCQNLIESLLYASTRES